MCDIEISKHEALARLSSASNLECRYEVEPNDGLTRQNFFARSSVLVWLDRAPHVFESGADAQLRDFGIYLRGQIRGRRALIFLPTKPECRLTAEQLRQSRMAGRGSDIFSLQIKN